MPEIEDGDGFVGPAPALNVGDVVCCKAGMNDGEKRVEMTVESVSINSDSVTCIWFAKAILQRGEFYAATLQRLY